MDALFRKECVFRNTLRDFKMAELWRVPPSCTQQIGPFANSPVSGFV